MTFGAGHSSLIKCAAYSPDGKLMASSAFKEKVIKLWDVKTGKHLGTLAGHKEDVRQLAFGPDSDILASASADKTVKLWDVSAKKETATLSGHTGAVNAVSFSPKGKLLASGSDDTTVRIWDVSGKKEASQMKKHTSLVKGVSFCPDGEILASCGWDGKVILLDVKTDKAKVELTEKDCYFNCVAFSLDGKVLAAGTSEQKKLNKFRHYTGEVVLWEMPTGKKIIRLTGHQDQVATVAFSSDGSLASADGRDVRLWRARAVKDGLTYERKAVFDKWPWANRFGMFSPDGKTLVTTYDGFGLHLIDVASGKELPPLQDFTMSVRGVAFSPKGDLLAAADKSTVRLWDTKSGKLVRILQGHGGRQEAVSFNPDGKELAAVGGYVTLWNVSSGKKTTTLKADGDYLDSLAFNPSGKYLATTATALNNEKRIRIWNHVAGLEFSSYKPKLQVHLGPVAYTPNGKLLVFAEESKAFRESQVVLWNPVTRKEWAVLKGHTDRVRSVAVSPNGPLIASGGDDSAIKVWKISTEKELYTLKGHEGGVFSVCFSPDSSLLASAGRDKTVRLWSLKEGKEIAVFRGHTDEVTSVQFSPDGKTVASGSRDATVKLWDVPGIKKE